MKKLLVAFLILAFGAIYLSPNADATGLLDKILNKSQPQNTAPKTNITRVSPASSADVNQTLVSLAPVIKKVIPAVVNISTKTKYEVNQQLNPLFNDPFFRQFFNFDPRKLQPQTREAVSVGSGVIVDAGKGFILTNNHVIDGADEVFVTLNDKRRLKAKLIGADKETDLAILQVEAENLTQIKLGNSNNVEVGDFVMAIGNPFGLGQTVTHGIVSALGRNGLGIEGYEDFIQTDASVNPGNSGGALVNLNGELIGINTAIVSRTGGSVGISFAIPMQMAENIMRQLMTGGTIERGQLGINIQDLTPELAAALKVQLNSGAVVAAVQKGSEGEKAGLKEGDIITKFNGVIIDGAAELKNRVGMSKIGEVVNLTILRDGKELQIKTVIGKKAAASSAAIAEATNSYLKGAKLKTITEDSPAFGKLEGVVVESIDENSAAAQTGLEAGDIITSVNKIKVTTPEQLNEAAKKSKSLLINLVRGNMAMYIVVQ